MYFSRGFAFMKNEKALTIKTRVFCLYSIIYDRWETRGTNQTSSGNISMTDGGNHNCSLRLCNDGDSS